MKNVRFLPILLATILLFTFVSGAAKFTPSIERKDGPVLMEEVRENDKLIITPIAHVYSDKHDVHEDIKENLKSAENDLRQKTISELIPNFEAIWTHFTGGAPIEHAVVSDIFDVRFESELTEAKKSGEEITFRVKIQGLTPEDKFILISRPHGEKEWQIDERINVPESTVYANRFSTFTVTTLGVKSAGSYGFAGGRVTGGSTTGGFGFVDTTVTADGVSSDVRYSIDKDGVLTITETTMCAFAIIRDNGADPAVDPNAPDSPQTGVSLWFAPAIVGAILFGAVAFVSAKKLSKRTRA